ncbi:hypothetical protein JCM11251_000817 [Rhodosporidiobolus azoricus]
MPAPRVQVLQPKPHFFGITPSSFTKVAPSLALWGGAALGALVVVGSSLPRFKSDVLVQVPFVAEYYIDKTPDSDKPFSRWEWR